MSIWPMLASTHVKDILPLCVTSSQQKQARSQIRPQIPQTIWVCYVSSLITDCLDSCALHQVQPAMLIKGQEQVPCTPLE